MNGAPEALNTLKELADAMTANAGAIDALEEIAAGHVKYDGAQSLTAEQQAQARANIDAVSSAQLSAVETKAQKGINDAAAAQSTANTNATNIGTLSSLTTTAKNTLVAAINEVKAKADKGVADAATAQAAANKAQGDIDAFKLAVGDTTTNFAAAYTAARDAA